MKTVERFVMPEDAHLLRMRLENAGIAAEVVDDLTAQVMPYMSATMGGVRVMVPDDQYEEALQYLRDDHP